jgi:hypothetical protein
VRKRNEIFDRPEEPCENKVRDVVIIVLNDGWVAMAVNVSRYTSITTFEGVRKEIRHVAKTYFVIQELKSITFTSKRLNKKLTSEPHVKQYYYYKK